MPAKTRFKRILGGLAGVLLVLILGYLVIRPWYLGWGATKEERSRSMPGDLAIIGWTRAITIDAPPEAIWQWLVQFGQGRGGWYSYDWLENLLGFDIHTADRIVPEYQNLALGDPICMAPGVCTSNIFILEQNQFLGWQTAAEDGSAAWNFVFGLFPIDAARTRLVVRESFGANAMPPPVLTIIEIPDGVMEQKALNTLKNRAEGIIDPPWVTVVEIAAWFAALVIGGIAGLLVLTRQNWLLPLLLGLASVIVLLVLTFLFPPLWLRGLLDLVLLSGLVWVLRK